MARTENLLEKLLIRVDGGNHQWHGLKSPMDTAETSPELNPPTVTPASDNAPVLSLFDNEPVRATARIRDLQFPLARAYWLIARFQSIRDR
jgi:hypothetical protein